MKKRYNKTLLLMKHLYHRGVIEIECSRCPDPVAPPKPAYWVTGDYRDTSLLCVGETKHKALISMLVMIDTIDLEKQKGVIDGKEV